LTDLHQATPESQAECLGLLLYLSEATPAATPDAGRASPRTEHRYQHDNPRYFRDYGRNYPERAHPHYGRDSDRQRDHSDDWSRPLPAVDVPKAQAFKVLVVSALFLIFAVTVILAARLATSVTLLAYWTFNAIETVFCLLTYINRRDYTGLPVARGTTIAIIPAYNEPTDKLHACVRSLIAQTVTIDRIVVVDDGSVEKVVPFYHSRVDWVRQSNRGKRGAHATALRGFNPRDIDFVLTVDSDSTPRPDALEHLLRAMSDRRVQAVTGWLWVRNYDESLIARAADVNIGSSCVMMRSSRSVLGALETTSGALSLYRSEILYDNLAEYEVECGTGDDRWLTMRALLRGDVVGVNEAIVETDMPASLKGTYHQRLRWARSWWWMLPFAFARLRWRAILSPTIGLIQMLAAPMLFLWAVLSWTIGYHTQFAHPITALAFIIAFLCVKYALAALYLADRRDMPTGEKLKSLLFGTPAAALMSMFLLLPVRYYALARIRDYRWRNREITPS
jgi:cellulose synthase/poly-beta-1,6-N-acetylglucosamine synthase-like glycosyltransferase